jgi:hypothetical protein
VHIPEQGFHHEAVCARRCEEQSLYTRHSFILDAEHLDTVFSDFTFPDKDQIRNQLTGHTDETVLAAFILFHLYQFTLFHGECGALRI